MSDTDHVIAQYARAIRPSGDDVARLREAAIAIDARVSLLERADRRLVPRPELRDHLRILVRQLNAVCHELNIEGDPTERDVPARRAAASWRRAIEARLIVLGQELQQ